MVVTVRIILIPENKKDLSLPNRLLERLKHRFENAVRGQKQTNTWSLMKSILGTRFNGGDKPHKPWVICWRSCGEKWVFCGKNNAKVLVPLLWSRVQVFTSIFFHAILHFHRFIIFLMMKEEGIKGRKNGEEDDQH